jgi:hypothetical protein
MKTGAFAVVYITGERRCCRAGVGEAYCGGVSLVGAFNKPKRLLHTSLIFIISKINLGLLILKMM